MCQALSGRGVEHSAQQEELGLTTFPAVPFFAFAITMSPRSRHPDSWRYRGQAFTLVEATVAMAILTIAGAAVLLGIDTSLQTTNDCLERTIAAGMARQLMDEVMGARYSSAAPSGGAAATGARQSFTSIGDYNGYRAQPPVDPWGVELGQDSGGLGTRHPNSCAPASMIRQWRQEIDVYDVSEPDFSQSLPLTSGSEYRAVEVRIVRVDASRGNRVLASLRQVVAYVPPLPPPP